VSLDPQPFERINVCGYRDLRVTRLADHGIDADLPTVAQDLTPHLLRHLGCEPSAVARGYSAINTDLQAVNSR
jgi:lipoyl(octanoyl) transferase